MPGLWLFCYDFIDKDTVEPSNADRPKKKEFKRRLMLKTKGKRTSIDWYESHSVNQPVFEEYLR